MPRRSKRAFQCQALADLTRQLLYAPAQRQTEQVRRAERLHDELDPTINYPLEYVVYRITRYRAQKESDTLLVGQAILPDLRLMIDRLTYSLEMSSDTADPIETGAQLGQRLHVSTKTLSRWRDLGLRWRWFLPADGKSKCVGYTHKAVEHFLARHGERVDRAAHFSHVDPDTRTRLLERARRIAQAVDVTLNQVAASAV